MSRVDDLLVMITELEDEIDLYDHGDSNDIGALMIRLSELEDELRELEG